MKHLQRLSASLRSRYMCKLISRISQPSAWVQDTSGQDSAPNARQDTSGAARGSRQGMAAATPQAADNSSERRAQPDQSNPYRSLGGSHFVTLASQKGPAGSCDVLLQFSASGIGFQVPKCTSVLKEPCSEYGDTPSGDALERWRAQLNVTQDDPAGAQEDSPEDGPGGEQVAGEEAPGGEYEFLPDGQRQQQGMAVLKPWHMGCWRQPLVM